MQTKFFTRCMILALIMVFMMAGTVFAGVSGSIGPTYPATTQVVPTIDMKANGVTGGVSLVIQNTSSNPNNGNPIIVSNIFHTPSCGSELSSTTCPAGFEQPGVITVEGAPATIVGGDNTQCLGAGNPFACCTGAGTGSCAACATRNFTMGSVNGTTGEVEFIPDITTGGANSVCTGAGAPFVCCTAANQGRCVVLAPVTSPGTTLACIINFHADLNSFPTLDSSVANSDCISTGFAAGPTPAACCTGLGTGTCFGIPGRQTAQLARANLNDAVTALPGSATGSSDITVVQPCLHVVKECTDAPTCTGEIGITVTLSNCGTEDINITGLTDDPTATFACKQGQADVTLPALLAVGATNIVCTSSYAGTQGQPTTDTVTVTATGSVSGTVSPDATSVLSAECSTPLPPSVTASKTCTSTLTCGATSANFSIHVCNDGDVDWTGTVSDTDCGITSQALSLAAHTCTGDAGAPANIACTDSTAPTTCDPAVAGAASCIRNTNGSISVTANGCSDSATFSAQCPVPLCAPCKVEITKKVAPDTDCNGVADSGFVDSVTVGATECVVYQICVINTGAQVLDENHVLVSDDVLGIVDLDFGTIAVGADPVCKTIPSETAAKCTGVGGTCVCQDVEGTNTARITAAVCEITQVNACDQEGSICQDTANVSCVSGCRMTGGHVNMAVDAEFDGLNGQVYTTGGQIGAPNNSGCCNLPPKGAKCVNGTCQSGLNQGKSCESNDNCPPSTGADSICPWGDWEHNHHAGPDDTYVPDVSGIADGSFAFHSGTAAAPDSAFIKSIICADPGWCVQARPAPDKQIFWEGTGVFHNAKGKKNQDIALPNFIACGADNQPVPWSNKVHGTLHYYRAHVGDFGEPAGVRQKDPSTCAWHNFCGPEGDVESVGGVSISNCELAQGDCEVSRETWPINDKFTALHPLCTAQTCDADTACPDWYEIEIHCGLNPSDPQLTGKTPEEVFAILSSQPVAYKVAHFITEGNFQLHPPVGSTCNPQLCGNGTCDTADGEDCISCPVDCPVCQ